MTQEEKQLVLKDLAARVPYGLMVDFYCNESRRKSYFATNLIGIEVDDAIIRDIENNGARIRVDMFSRDCNIKPYLRHLSAMTDAERDYVYELSQLKCTPDKAMQKIDFYNSHFLDYRCLIQKGLALEAPEGMYTKN
jgi:hypothetical protein